MAKLTGKARRKAVGQAFLNIFTIMVPASITSEALVKLNPLWRIALCGILLSMLILGWVITPEEEIPAKEKER